MISSDFRGDVGQLDACNQAAVKGHDGCRKINPAGDLIRGAHPVWLASAARMAARSWPAASTRAGSVRLADVVSSAQRRAERLQANWAFPSVGLSLSMTPA